jgi:peptidoglycan/LPS O-acetylase OafA/YrhL
LMPALAVLVVVMTPLGLMAGDHDAARSGTAALTYVMDIYAPLTHGAGGIFAHTWSLAVEEQFYLVWPIVLLTLLRHSRLRMVAIAVTAAAVLSFGLTAAGAKLRPNELGDLYRTPFPHLPVIIAGVLLALLASTAVGEHRLRILGNVAIPITVLALLVAVSLTVHEFSLWLYEGGFVIAAIGCAALVGHVLVAPRSIVSRVLSLGPVLWLGRRSYGFYLWHFPVLYLLADHVTNVSVLIAVGFAISAVCTELSWRIVEQPFLHYKDRHFAARALAPINP